jgi:hypothetical protein
MFTHTSYDILIEICLNLKVNEILNLVICNKYLNLIHIDPILWKLIFYRDFPIYEVIEKKSKIDYHILYKKCLYSKCDASTSCYSEEEKPINNISIVEGTPCYITLDLTWYSVSANTKILIPGYYNIYWRLKVFNDSILSHKEFMFLDNTIIKLKELTINDQNKYKRNEWNEICAGKVLIQNIGHVTALLENKRGYCIGHGVDTVFFLPEELRIK